MPLKNSLCLLGGTSNTSSSLGRSSSIFVSLLSPSTWALLCPSIVLTWIHMITATKFTQHNYHDHVNKLKPENDCKNYDFVNLSFAWCFIHHFNSAVRYSKYLKRWTQIQWSWLRCRNCNSHCLWTKIAYLMQHVCNAFHFTVIITISNKKRDPL